MRAGDPAFWTALAIAVAVVLGLVRMALWQRSAPPQSRAPAWRIGALAALQVAAGALLWLTLFPPRLTGPPQTLVVATRGAPTTIALAPGEVLIALPEAGSVVGAARAPDLASALRRHPGATGVRVVGGGLAPRDWTASALPVTFAPPPPPRGLVEFAPPSPVAPGAVFVVGGQVGTLASGRVELVDLGGAVVDRASVVANGRFVLEGGARAAGLALFELRLRDGSGALIERMAVPVEARVQAPPEVLVLAGAPNAETKFLTRWAQEAGVVLTLDIDIGAGVRLGSAAPLSATALESVDLVVIEDRRWDALSPGARAALTRAVAGGLGLVLRPTGAPSPTVRRDWAALGLPLSGGDAAVPTTLAPSGPPAEATTADAATPADAAPAPELARRDLGLESPETVALLRDADGAPLAGWRGVGRGRVGVWTLGDSYVLTLTGQADRYAELWSALFSTLGRPADDARARPDGLARAGSRIALCDLVGTARVLGPEADDRPLLVDPASGDKACAAYWPAREGWHVVRDGSNRESAFYVHPAEAAPSLIAAADRGATLALVAGTAGVAPGAETPRASGSPWPWFAGLVVVLAALWTLERARGGAGLARLRARWAGAGAR